MGRSNRPAKYSTRALAVMAKYELPEETPSLISSTVAEIERDLRKQFPEVFAAAIARERSRQHADDLVRSSLF